LSRSISLSSPVFSRSFLGLGLFSKGPGVGNGASAVDGKFQSFKSMFQFLECFTPAKMGGLNMGEGGTSKGDA